MIINNILWRQSAERERERERVISDTYIKSDNSTLLYR